MNKRILITVSGGVAEVDQSTIPEGIEVEIKNYDVLTGIGDRYSGCDLKKDENGRYEKTLWSRVT